MRMMLLRAALASLILLSATGAMTAAMAADKPNKEAAFGKGGGALLTKEQLRACLAHQSLVKQQDAEMLKEQAALAQAKTDVTQSGDALKARLDSVDRTNAEAVASYNEAGAARDKLIDDYEARVTAFNSKVDAQKAERAAFGTGCQNRRYLEDDETAIKNGK